MIKIAELENYISDNILDSIFIEREEDIYSTKVKMIELEEIKKNNTMTYEEVQTIIKKLPTYAKDCKENILEALEQYSERQNLIQSFDNEKFYKAGFCDGMKMIIDIYNK